jgi:hypothetical protein
MSDHHGHPQVRLSSELVASGIAAVAMFVSPEAAALAVAGQPAVAAAIESMARLGLRRVSAVATNESGLTAQQLVDELTKSDDGVRLLIRTLDVAQTAADDVKLRALGRCLAAAVADDARIDEEMLLVGAIAVLEMPHFRMLSVLSQARRPHPEDKSSEEVDTWRISDLPMVDDALTPDVAESLIGHLVAQGIVSTRTGYAELEYAVTSPGRRLLLRARAVASDTE